MNARNFRLHSAASKASPAPGSGSVPGDRLTTSMAGAASRIPRNTPGSIASQIAANAITLFRKSGRFPGFAGNRTRRSGKRSTSRNCILAVRSGIPSSARTYPGRLCGWRHLAACAVTRSDNQPKYLSTEPSARAGSGNRMVRLTNFRTYRPAPSRAFTDSCKVAILGPGSTIPQAPAFGNGAPPVKLFWARGFTCERAGGWRQPAAGAHPGPAFVRDHPGCLLWSVAGAATATMMLVRCNAEVPIPWACFVSRATGRTTASSDPRPRGDLAGLSSGGRQAGARLLRPPSAPVHPHGSRHPRPTCGAGWHLCHRAHHRRRTLARRHRGNCRTNARNRKGQPAHRVQHGCHATEDRPGLRLRYGFQRQHPRHQRIIQKVLRERIEKDQPRRRCADVPLSCSATLGQISGLFKLQPAPADRFRLH